MLKSTKGKIPMGAGGIFILFFILALILLALPGREPPKGKLNPGIAQSSLRTLCIAAENYYSHTNTYPADINALLSGNPPYLVEDLCATTSPGYSYDCRFSPGGYELTAWPVGATWDTQSKSYTMRTKCVLNEQ